MVVKSYIFFPVVEIFITVVDEVQYFTTKVYKAYFQSVQHLRSWSSSVFVTFIWDNFLWKGSKFYPVTRFVCLVIYLFYSELALTEINDRVHFPLSYSASITADSETHFKVTVLCFAHKSNYLLLSFKYRCLFYLFPSQTVYLNIVIVASWLCSIAFLLP